VADIDEQHVDDRVGVPRLRSNAVVHAGHGVEMGAAQHRHGETALPEPVSCSIVRCVATALERYPFSETERPLVTWRQRDDFVFKGAELLTVHLLFNLIKNALRQIARSRTGSIEIATIAGPRSNRLVVLDTAGGIPPEDLPHVFSRFYSSAASDGILGAGIGLAFCRDVMHAFGGSIECSSAYGQRTEFVMRFPTL